MPDDVSRNDILSEKHQKGIERLEQYLNKECSKKPIRLNERQVTKYKKRGAVAGWAIQPPDIAQRIIVFVDSRYPFSIPKTAIDPAPASLTYPHVEKDGYLCIAEVAVPKDEEALELVAQNIIAESVELIKKCVSGENQKDFQDEILSYWDRAKSDNTPKCYSLLDLDKDKTAREVKVWKRIGDKKINFVADTCEEGERWLNQKFGKECPWDHEDALFAWSDKILTPQEYPQNNQEVCDLLRNHCGREALGIYQELAGKTPEKIDVIIGFETDAGKALVGIVLDRPRDSSSYRMTARQELTKGFRAGNVNPVIAGNRYASAKAISQRLNIQRVDPSWTLSRDSNKRIKALKDKTVTIVGCGSIGSEIARMLAQNGISTFNLIDPDTMDWENLGRHALGAESIDIKGSDSKTSMLEETLKSQFPHITILSAHSEKWENVLVTDPESLHESDLIIMATGDWPAENAMNKYMLAQKSFPPILYGWAEAYAAAGHSFAVLENGGCFNCAFDDTTFKFKLTQFPNEQQRLPTCGGVFQPFRSIELAPINAIIAAHAIDILTSKIKHSQIRSWVGSQDILVENKGKWTDIAAKKMEARGASSGQFLMQLDFDKIPTCKACGHKETACNLQTTQTSVLPLKVKS